MNKSRSGVSIIKGNEPIEIAYHNLVFLFESKMLIHPKIAWKYDIKINYSSFVYVQFSFFSVSLFWWIFYFTFDFCIWILFCDEIKFPRDHPEEQTASKLKKRIVSCCQKRAILPTAKGKKTFWHTKNTLFVDYFMKCDQQTVWMCCARIHFVLIEIENAKKKIIKTKKNCQSIWWCAFERLQSNVDEEEEKENGNSFVRLQIFYLQLTTHDAQRIILIINSFQM